MRFSGILLVVFGLVMIVAPRLWMAVNRRQYRRTFRVEAPLDWRSNQLIERLIGLVLVAIGTVFVILSNIVPE